MSLLLSLALLLVLALPAAAQTPCVVPAGPVALPLSCAAGPYTSPGVTFTPVVVPPDPIPPDPTDPLADIPPGTWAKRGTKITTVFPMPEPPGGSAGVFAYSGAVRAGDFICILGGGHQDSGDNSVYCFNTRTLVWSRPWGPSSAGTIPAKGSPCSTARKYADGAPSARHTYHGIHALGATKVLLVGGSMWCGAGDAASDAWVIDLAAKTWTETQPPPFYTPLGLKGGVLADGTVYMNASTSNNQLWRRLPTGAWSLVGGPPAPYGNASAIDPKRRLIVYLVNVGTGIGIATQSIDTGALSARNLTGDPLPKVATAQLGSLDVDDSTDRVIVWAGEATPYAVNLDDNTVARLPGLGTPPGPPSSAGTFGRWRCLPGRGVCVLLRSASEEPFVYRTTRAGPVPPQPPTQYTMTVSQTGTGHGTVGGAGSYAAGATVPLSATPDAGSTFGGWVETPCRVSPYLMPAANALCTATFTASSTPPPDTGALIPGTFLRLAAPTWRGPSAGSKHVTATYRPDDQWIYLQGGDFIDSDTINLHRSKGWGEPDDSYRQNGYRFNLAARLAGGPNSGWERIQEYCQASLTGGLQPKYPDFIGWAWDATRKMFWIAPGLYYKANQSKAVCPGETYSELSDPAYRWGRVMSYAPDEPAVDRRWTDVGGDSLPHDSWASFHDPQQDTLVRMGHHGGNGGEVHVFSIATQTWARKQLESAATGSLRLMRSLPCVDLPNRRAFIGDPWTGKWWRYNMDARTVEAIPAIPYGKQQDRDEDGQLSADLYSYAAWRPNFKECWVWRNDFSKLLVYQSDLNTWREEPWTTQVPGGVPRVLHAITWHAALDALVFLGNRTSGSTGIWVYKP